MFGLAIWDARRESSIVARDAMGIKPVYYRIDQGALYFASEMRAAPAVCRRRRIDVDPVALNLFLRYRYTPSPSRCSRESISSPRARSWSSKNGSARVQRWYRFMPTPFDRRSGSRGRARAAASVSRRARAALIGDVPVGLLLSGGIDSGLLLALMNEVGRAWRTYTVGYGTSFEDDELEDARQTARMFSSDTRVRRDDTGGHSSGPCRRWSSAVEEPVAASSIVPMYIVCERARQDVKVALIGQGPDELFGGYTRHWACITEASGDAMPRPCARHGAGRCSLDAEERVVEARPLRA